MRNLAWAGVGVFVLAAAGCGAENDASSVSDMCTGAEAAPIAVASLRMDEGGGGCTVAEDGYLMGSLARPIYLDGVASRVVDGCAKVQSYHWDVVQSPSGHDAGAFTLDGAETRQPVFRATAPGEFTIRLTVTDANGISSAEAPSARMMFRFAY